MVREKYINPIIWEKILYANIIRKIVIIEQAISLKDNIIFQFYLSCSPKEIALELIL